MKTILVVDDEPNNLQLLRQILKDQYDLMFANGGKKCLELAKSHDIDLILLDIMMPDMSGYDVCKTLKSDPSTQSIPVIFVTAMSDVDDEAKGFDVGAVDYIQKPVSGPIVLRRVQTHLSLVRAHELEASQRAAIYMLGKAGHYNDTDTGSHIWRMAAYAKALALKIGWSSDKADFLELAASMHDTGKIGTPDGILKAPRKLSDDEWVTMKEHSEIGYQILSMGKTEIFQMAAEIARYHHEHWDGSGYPNGLKETEIPESARIVAIADVFDALTMRRPYKDAWPIDKSVEEIKIMAGKDLDPNLVEVFLSILPTILELKEQWQDQE